MFFSGPGLYYKVLSLELRSGKLFCTASAGATSKFRISNNFSAICKRLIFAVFFFARAIWKCSIFQCVFCKFNTRIFCCLGSFSKDDHDHNDRDLARVSLKVAFASAGSLQRFFTRKMQQGLGISLVLWKGDLRVQHFPEISRRDDLNMLFYQGPRVCNRGFQTVVRGS